MTTAALASTRAVTRERYGVAVRHLISPSDYRCTTLAEALADKWIAVAPEIPGSSPDVAWSVRGFLRFLDARHGDAAERMSLSDLRRADLDAWEQALLERQKTVRTDTPYRYAVHLFALLRRLEDDEPGSLCPEVADRVRRQTRLSHVRRPGPPEFSVWERRRLIRAAKRLVDQELHFLNGSPTFEAPPRDVLIACAILLGFGFGEPPEVIRSLTLDDIRATPDKPGDVRSIGQLAECDAVHMYLVTFTKRRAGTVYDDTYGRHDRLAFWSLTALIRLTNWARERLGTSDLWLARHKKSDGANIRLASWTDGYSLAAWAERHLPETGPSNPFNPRLSGPVTYSRLRKTLVAREAIEDPARYLRTDRRHTAKTFFDHYSQSPVLRARAGRVVVEAITELFDAAIAGPLVVTPEAEALLRRGVVTKHLDGVEVEALLAGEFDGPLAACRNPLESPFAPAGSVCPVSANGQCYSCRNAVITERHLPAVLSLVDTLDPNRFGNVEAWRQLWQPIYRFLIEVVLPQFGERALSEAQQGVSGVYLDPSLHQDLGGIDDRP